MEPYVQPHYLGNLTVATYRDEDDRDDGYLVCFFSPKGLTLEEWRECVATEYHLEAQHCQHEWDCCGHFYGNGLVVVNENFAYISYWRNV